MAASPKRAELLGNKNDRPEDAAQLITKFDSSYVGSVDLEDAGYLGKPINDRRYSNEQLADVLHKAVAYAKQMDGWATTPSGWPSTISSRKARSASRTS